MQPFLPLETQPVYSPGVWGKGAEPLRGCPSPSGWIKQGGREALGVLMLMERWSCLPLWIFQYPWCAALAFAGKSWIRVEPPGSSGGAQPWQRGCWRGEGHCGIVSPSQEPWGLPCLSGKPASFPLLTWKCSFPVQTCRAARLPCPLLRSSGGAPTDLQEVPIPAQEHFV